MQCIPSFLRQCLRLALVFSVLPFLQRAIAQSDPPQSSDHQNDSRTAQSQPTGTVNLPQNVPSTEINSPMSSSTLLVGPGDELEVTVYGAPDLSGRTRVNADGNISIPLVGYVRVAGLTNSEVEGTIESELRQNNILKDPQVSVYVKEYTGSGITVAGEVARPGFYSALGPHRLFDILQSAGGLSDRASGSVTISHKGTTESPVTVEVSKDPTEMVHNNVELYPSDTVFAARAPTVYVLGEVNKPGAYVLNTTGAVTVLRLVAEAGGPTRSAAAGRARMLRRTPNGLRELPVPLKDLLRGKTADIPVSPEDIIFIPSSHTKAVVTAATMVGMTAATAAVYHVY
jgi:polysaccharide export outer membrane protein